MDDLRDNLDPSQYGRPGVKSKEQKNKMGFLDFILFFNVELIANLCLKFMCFPEKIWT
jgi:hypothetical protein